MADDCKRGRKRTLTDSARKKNRKKIQSNYNKARINIGSEFDRWNALKSELDLSSHEEVAKVLLDRLVILIFRFNKLLIQIQSKCKICNKTTNFLKTVILIHAFVKIMNSIRSVKTISAV